MYTISPNDSSICSKVHKTKKNIPLKCITYKKIRIARKITSKVGLPKPLSVEEDFVLEKNNSTLDFLNPLSGYYKLPELGDFNTKSQTTFDGKNLRYIVGSVEGFRTSVLRQKKVNLGDDIKKNQNFFTLTSQSIKKPGFQFPIKPYAKILKDDDILSMSKAEILHNKHAPYWDIISSSIPKKIIVRKKQVKLND
ncbi:hypothetical protein SteCoe_14 [Stentor coeruleus]|uniref:Uncharacterized protein n=1 Tax=Stentor coeruleus TaxID=5963 RepID=A0A1R2D4U6_9CILI|nr:hypothetical protein SteCoe_14 [Stentor coeruleus]